MECQPQNPEFRINSENFYPCAVYNVSVTICDGPAHGLTSF